MFDDSTAAKAAYPACSAYVVRQTALRGHSEETAHGLVRLAPGNILEFFASI
jgi:hypothetical protein